MTNYSGNTQKSKSEKKIAKIANGKIKNNDEEKQGFKEISKNIVHELLIPSMQDMATDAFSNVISIFSTALVNGIGTAIQGDNYVPPRKNRSSSYVDYGGFSKKNNRYKTSERRSPKINRSQSDIENISFDHRSEAVEVLSVMLDAIRDYDLISVADLYILVGIGTNYTDKKYGWYNLDNASVKHTLDGWELQLPKPVIL